MKSIIIPKCWHYSLCLPSLFTNSSHAHQTYNVVFTESCRYSIDEPSCVNKVFGFTHGLFGVHKESDRFGWTYDSELNKIVLYAYVYTNSKLTKTKIGTVDINQSVYLSITSYNKSNEVGVPTGTRVIEFFINDEMVYSQTGKEISGCMKRHIGLTPYFGGNTRAPHRIEIKMEKYNTIYGFN